MARGDISRVIRGGYKHARPSGDSMGGDFMRRVLSLARDSFARRRTSLLAPLLAVISGCAHFDGDAAGPEEAMVISSRQEEKEDAGSGQPKY